MSQIQCIKQSLVSHVTLCTSMCYLVECTEHTTAVHHAHADNSTKQSRDGLLTGVMAGRWGRGSSPEEGDIALQAVQHLLDLLHRSSCP